MSIRLFHVSEESSILKFIPRIPVREDMDKSKGLVWAINQKCLPNFLTPRDCPRITYHIGKHTSKSDIQKYFSSYEKHCLTIENVWFERMLKTQLYVYEFNTENFHLQDECAGYFVSEKMEEPLSVRKISNLFEELFKLNIEVRIIDNLWDFADEVKHSTLNYSICRMGNAQPRFKNI